jgi:hypothetical protein
MKRKYLIIPIFVIIALFGILRFIVSMGYLEKFGINYISKTLRKNGITFLAESTEGNIKDGVMLKGVSIKGENFEFEIDKIFLKGRRTPIFFGTFAIKELKIENVKGNYKTNSLEPPSGFNIPIWLNIFAKNIFITVDRIDVEGKRSFFLEKCEITTKLRLVFEDITFNDFHLKVDRTSFNKPLVFNGNLKFNGLKKFSLDGHLNFGESEGQISTKFDLRKKISSIEIDVKNFKTNLDDFNFFYNFPPLKLTANMNFIFEDNSFKLKGDFDQKEYGNFELEISGKIDSDFVKGKIFLVSKPLYYSIGVKDIKNDKLQLNLSLKGDYNYSFKAKNLKSNCIGDFKESSVLGMEVSSGKGEISIEGKDLNIFSTFVSREAGKGEIEIDYNFLDSSTKIRFRTVSIYPSKVLSVLGIDVPLPAPLKFSQNRFDIPLAELVFNEKETEVTLEARDENFSPYYVDINFKDLSLTKINLQVDKINPSFWGVDEPFRFSGNLLFDFTKDYITIDVSKGFFHFEIFAIGEIETKLKILNGNSLVIPPTKVPLPFGELAIEGLLDSDGNFSGKGNVHQIEIAKLLKNGIEGSLKGEFKFKGNFSKIDIEGKLNSEVIKESDFNLENLSIEGNLSLTDKDFFCDLVMNSRNGLLLQKPYENFNLKILKTPNENRFESSLSFKDLLNFYAKGSFDSELKNVVLNFSRIDIQKKSLYLDSDAEISFQGNLISVKNFKLLSGTSSIFAEGSYDKEKKGLNGKLQINDLPIALLPIKGYFSSLKGRIDSDIKLGGTVKDPDFKGEFSLRNLTLPLESSNLKVLGLIKCDLEGDKIKLSNVYLTTNEEGELKVDGYLKISNFIPYDYDVTLKAQDFPVIYKNLFSVVTDIDLSLKGDEKIIGLNGNVIILKGRIQPSSKSISDLPESIVFLNSATQQKKSNFTKDILQKLRGAIKINAKKKLWIVRKDLIAQIQGETILKFTKKGFFPEGKLSVNEGRFLVSGSKFDLTDSSVYFSEGDNLEPYLDIKGTKNVGSYNVNVRLQGPFDKPTLSFSSIPPLEEGDILSLILFGRPSQNLSPEESEKWGSTAASLALSYEATPLFKSVSKRVKIDTLSVSTSKSGDAQLTFSKYLNDRLVVEYEQTFGSLPESEINLRYRINNHFSVETNSSTAGKSGADITWEQRY